MTAAQTPFALGATRMGTTMDVGRTCAVRLIDRRTGKLHQINGTPLTIFTRRPAEAVAELLEGRNPLNWEIRIEPLDPQVQR